MRLNGRWLAALLLLAALPLSGCGFIQKLQSRDYLNKGVKAFSDQKYADAVSYFNKSIELDPSIEETHMYLGWAYNMQFIPGSLEPNNEAYARKAIETFTNVVDESTKKGTPNVNAMVAIVNLSYQLKNIDQTREWCQRILNLEAKTEEDKKNQAEAHYRMAVMLFDTVNEKTGITGENVQNLSQEDKDEILKYIDEGLEDLNQAIEIRPKYSDAFDYQNLLWREKEKIVEDKETKLELLKMADKAYSQALKLKLEAAAEEAAKHKTLDLGN